MPVTINDKKYTKEEAKKIMEDPNVIITSVTIDFPSTEKKPGEPMTNEGFEITKEQIASLSKSMDKFEAGFMGASFENSGKIMGKSLYIFLMAPGYVPKWKMIIWKLMRKLIS